MPHDRPALRPYNAFRVPRSAALASCNLLLVALALVVAWTKGAAAIVGGAANADPSVARHIALIVGSRGTSCTGVVIARNLVLTAAHCALPGADYKIVEFDAAPPPDAA